MTEMFEGYSKAMIDFFWSVKFNNNREWFNQNKPTYVKEVYEPTKALANDVCELLSERSKRDIGWKCSRIYRDARRPCPDGPYKDKLWFVLWERYEWWSLTPTFYAEVSAAGISYGLGLYTCSPDFMKRYRAKIEANPAAFERMMKKFYKDGIFDVFGEDYKRPKGHISDYIDQWYNKKSIDFLANEEWNDENMGAELPAYLTRRFETLLPLYTWLWDCAAPLE